MIEIPEKLKRQFHDVTRERVQELSQQLSQMMKNPENKSLYEPVWQTFHKIHGSAALYGYERVGVLAGQLEELLKLVSEAGSIVDEGLVSLMIEVNGILDLIAKGDEPGGNMYEAVESKMNEFLGKNSK